MKPTDISRLGSIIRKTWAYQKSNKSFARHWHVRTPINHSQGLAISRHNQSFARLWAYQDWPINHSHDLAYQDSNKSSQVIGISILYYQTQDLSISIKTRLISHKTWVCHRVLVKYILHLYCLAVQVGFYSDMVECSTLDRRVPGSILIRGMEIFLRVCDRCIKTLINHSQNLIGHVKTLINRSEDLGISRLQSIVASHWHFRTPINH